MNPCETSAVRNLAPILTAFLALLPAVAQAQFEYTNNHGTITITRYTGPGGNVTIPETLGRLFVTSIGASAFEGCTGLTGITIPNSITNIGNSAFRLCSSLTNITLPSNVMSIGEGVFNHCDSLTAIGVDPSNPFYSSLGGVVFNFDRTAIMAYPGGKAGAYLIPSTITRIRNFEFVGCRGLTGVTIPNTVTNIRAGAFSLCINLTAIEVDPANPSYCAVEGVLFNSNQTTTMAYPGGKTGAYSIPNSVTSIGQSAFYSCRGLTSVTIPEGVTNIGHYAFTGCSGLTTVSIPPRVTDIGRQSFSECTNLISVAMPDSVTRIGEFAFSHCVSLANFTIPNGISRINRTTFSTCTSLISISIPNGIKSIDSEAFIGCRRLTTVTIPGSVTFIANDAFSFCTDLTGAFFQGNAPHFWYDPFRQATNVTVYYLPGTMGWTSTFADRPTAPWTNPLLSTTSLQADATHFAYTISWAPNASLVVESCSDFANASWSPLSTNTPTSGTWNFSDTDRLNHPTRFYRVRSP